MLITLFLINLTWMLPCVITGKFIVGFITFCMSGNYLMCNVMRLFQYIVDAYVSNAMIVTYCC